jgi:SAM-dependent methyltransferase
VDPRLYAPLRELERTHWWFRGRRRILLAALERAGVGGQRSGAAPGPGGAVKARVGAILDVGCGAGTNLELLAERFPGARLHGIDVERAPLRFCRADRGLPVAQADALHLPFASGSFDVVAALDALEHLPDDGAALREIHRVCRPGGTLVASVPAFGWLWGSVDDLGHHYRRYRRGELRARVEAGGFGVALERYFNYWLLPAVAAVRIGARAVRPRGALAAASRDAPEPAASDFDWAARGPLAVLLERIFSSEAHLLALRVPFGVSLLCIGRRI